MTELFVSNNDEATMQELYDYVTGKSNHVPSGAEKMLHRFLTNLRFMRKAESRDKSMQGRGEEPKKKQPHKQATVPAVTPKEVWHDVPTKISMRIKGEDREVTLKPYYQVSTLGRIRNKARKTLVQPFHPSNYPQEYVNLSGNDGSKDKAISFNVDALIVAACTGNWDIFKQKVKVTHIDGDPSNHSFINLKVS